MGCNCKGKLPNSVSLRQACVAYAAQAANVDLSGGREATKFIEFCKQIETFVRGTATDADIDGAPDDQKPDDQSKQTAEQRQELLHKPVAVLALREPLVAMWESAACNIVSDVIQATFPTVPKELREATEAALALHGLRLRMTTGEIRRWLKHGHPDHEET